MLTDPREQALAAAFKAARPLPREGWEGRALAALAEIRPRRHPNLVTYIIVAALLLLLAAGVFAAVRYFFVEGTLQFSEYRSEGVHGWGGHFTTRLLSGELEWQMEDLSMHDKHGDFSSARDQVVVADTWGLLWPYSELHILRLDTDGSNEVNLTEIAGLGGVNCDPKWSPDGTMIVFKHCDSVEGLLPCEAGFHLWVMNADGSDAHQVMPEGSLPTRDGCWSPDSSRLIMQMGEREQASAIATDLWGTDVLVLPNVGMQAVWSPDGSMIASCRGTEATLDGEAGQWRQLLLTDADGSNPRVLVEQFVAEADIRAHYPTEDQLAVLPNVDHWIVDVQHWAGPCSPVWSPGGDQIAFLAALPFEPDGPYYRNQAEVWVYDLNTDELIRVTDDDVAQTSLSWK
jgi:hypothetical protein